MSLTGQAKVVQLHPTRRCNLRCRHCYSGSGPEVREALALPLLIDALADLRDEGYSVVSLSGGEPLLYGELFDLLAGAKRLGLKTTLTSNGMLLTRDKLGRLKDDLDLLAISLDGRPESHNRMRAHARAFDVMHSRLDALRDSGIPFGFIFTLTQHNLDELEWVMRYAKEQGASLLQIHPLESIGRAAAEMDHAVPDGIEATMTFLEAARLQQQTGDGLRLQIDLSHRQSLRQNPAKFYADDARLEDAWSKDVPLSTLISPLVVESDGTVVPLQYGFSRDYSLGSLHDARLAVLAARWKAQTLPRFRELCRAVHGEATRDETSLAFFNWYDNIRHAAAQTAVG